MMLTLSAATSALAQETEVVIARNYVRGTGQPVSVTDSFEACDPAGSFTLVVVNGPDGQPRVSSGTVTVNERVIVTELDFQQPGSRIERGLSPVLPVNSLQVRLTSQPGATIMLSVVAVQACGIKITSPAPGAVVNPGEVLVRGRLAGQVGGDLGITVNGMPALSSAGEFVTRVPVMPGTASLVATLTDASGSVLARHEVPVVVGAPEPASGAWLEVWPPGGSAPLEVTLRVDSFASTEEFAFDLDGDGTLDTPFGPAKDMDHTYAQSGVYLPTVHVREHTGSVSKTSALVWVADPAALNARLQSIWTGLKDALRNGNVSQALGFIHSDTRQTYERMWTRLDPATLAAVDTILTSIALVEIGPGDAEYEMLRQRGADTLSFAVRFELDLDGVWRLRRF
jgi:hypothetical protein